MTNYPNSFKAHFNLGKVAAALGDWSASIAQMREVMRIAPERPEGHLFLARGLLHEGAPLDEVQALTQKGLALASAPDMKALGWFLMADVFQRRNQPERMADALNQAKKHAASVKQRHAGSSVVR